MTTREALIRSALIAGDRPAADRLRAKTDEEVDEGLRAFAALGRQMQGSVQAMAAEFAKAAPALRSAIARIDAS